MLSMGLQGVSCQAFSAPISKVSLLLVDRADGFVTKGYSGIASASLNTARQMGGILGVAILGTLLGNQALFTGTEEAVFIMLGAFLLGLVLILSTTRGARSRSTQMSVLVVPLSGFSRSTSTLIAS